MALADNRKRARSDDEKHARRAMILNAARAMIAESGFDGVTMAGLARRAGLAKGTLYLYVRTKEELLLALFVEAMAAMVARLETQARADTLAEDIAHAAEDEPLFLPLLARLVAVIEANVADAPLFAAKREIMALSARLVARVAALYGVGQARAEPVVSALILALQGAAQFDITAGRDPAALPDDLRPVFAAHAFGERFPPAARLILSSFAQPL
jgi:AcrR family transcriptional regulator